MHSTITRTLWDTCFKLVLASLGPCKLLIYIGPKRVYSVKFARVLTIAQVEASNYSATGILINPSDWANIVNTKNVNSAYSLPGSTVVTTDGQLSIAGIPIFKSTAITADKFLVGDWSMGAQIMQRNGISVQFFDQDGNNAVENMITVRVEARIAFPIYYAGAFCYGDFGNQA